MYNKDLASIRKIYNVYRRTSINKKGRDNIFFDKKVKPMKLSWHGIMNNNKKAVLPMVTKPSFSSTVNLIEDPLLKWVYKRYDYMIMWWLIKYNLLYLIN